MSETIRATEYERWAELGLDALMESGEMEYVNCEADGPDTERGEWWQGPYDLPADPVPDDFPVRPVPPGDGMTTCGYCGRSWDDRVVTSMTPAPGARCPFEEFRGPYKVIFHGTFGNYNSPGASHYTYAELYDMHDPDEAAEFARDLAEWEAAEEYAETDGPDGPDDEGVLEESDPTPEEAATHEEGYRYSYYDVELPDDLYDDEEEQMRSHAIDYARENAADYVMPATWHCSGEGGKYRVVRISGRIRNA